MKISKLIYIYIHIRVLIKQRIITLKTRNVKYQRKRSFKYS
jgi:hypothetical protein